MLLLRSVTSSTLFSQFIFLSTGIITTIGYQYLLYKGAADKTSLLPVAANYYGTALALFLPEEKTPIVISAQHPKLIIPKTNWNFHARVFLISIFEILGNVFSILGIIYAGSGVFQVIYSSLVIFTAIWARIFLRKKLASGQWYAILIVTLGLSFSAFGNKDISNDQSQWGSLLGAVFTLLCTIMYSFVYIISEGLLTSKNPPSPQRLQTFDGIYVAILVTIYLITYTIPNFKTLVYDKVEEHQGVWSIIIMVYMVLVLSGFLHSYTHFKLLSSIGSVSTGILQSLRAISVFAFSAWFFCEGHPNQCFTISKGISTVIVIGGILYFSRVGAQNATKKGGTDEV